MTSEAAPATSVPAAPWAIAGLSFAMLLSSLGTSIANVALPTLAEAFGAPFQDVQWVVLAYLLAVTTLIVSVGRLGDLIGRRRLLLAGIALFTAASILCSFATNLPMLIAARAIQGLGAAVMMALSMAFVGDIVPKAKTGSAMGLLGTMSAVGTALGPTLGGVVISCIGWPAIFLVNVPLGLLAFAFAFHALPADKNERRGDQSRFDVLGTLLLALALAAYALAMTVGRGSFGGLNVALLLVAAAGTGLFVLAQANVASPLIQLAMFRSSTLNAGLVTNILVSTVMMATLVVGPFYLSRALGLDLVLVGLVMSVGPIISALSGVLAGRLVDQLGARRTVTFGLTVMTAGAAALAVLPAMLGVAGYIAAIAILTPGYQLFQAANNTVLMLDIRSDQRGVVSGILNLSRNLGLITGASAMGAVFAIASSTVDMAAGTPGAVAMGMLTTFAVATLLIVVATGIALLGNTVSRRG